jgi:hypothetical protein
MEYDVSQHIQALRSAMMAEHEAQIADVQRKADDAAAEGDEWYRKLYQDLADSLQAMDYPWETRSPAMVAG